MKQEVTEDSLLGISTSGTDNQIQVKVMMILSDRHYSWSSKKKNLKTKNISELLKYPAVYALKSLSHTSLLLIFEGKNSWAGVSWHLWSLTESYCLRVCNKMSNTLIPFAVNYFEVAIENYCWVVDNTSCVPPAMNTLNGL